eukprot:GHVO01034316.1.p1 GENE.GHVO01034316.1~~GHVO01034316.1.p1  ORF type:complete len:661 (-),score=59.70 GHVO01034316.1:164-2146(-)
MENVITLENTFHQQCDRDASFDSTQAARPTPRLHSTDGGSDYELANRSSSLERNSHEPMFAEMPPSARSRNSQASSGRRPFPTSFQAMMSSMEYSADDFDTFVRDSEADVDQTVQHIPAATADTDKSSDSLSSAGPPAGLVFSLICMLLTSVVCNFDHGAIPACLGDIQSHFDLSFIQQSLLGSLVYAGLIAGTLAAGIMFQRLAAKWILVASLTILSAALVLFGLVDNLLTMYAGRFLGGVAQALPIVYMPVWIDEFSPPTVTARWMSLSQLASIFGTVSGYFLGGVLSHWTPPEKLEEKVHVHFTTSWRTPFLAQAVGVVPLIIAFALIKPSYLEINNGERKEEKGAEDGGWGRHKHMEVHGFTSKEEAHGTETQLLTGQMSGFVQVDRNPSRCHSIAAASRLSVIAEDQSCGDFTRLLCRQIKRLLSDSLYVLLTIALANLYYVVTGIQFWITEYLVVVLKVPKLMVVSITTFVFLTSPTSGVYFGGWICDYLGGYRGDISQRKRAVQFAAVFAGVSAAFAMATAFLYSPIPFGICMWLSLFSGAALLPVAVGVVMSSVPTELRPLSSAISQVTYNLLGWFAAPLISGTVMDICRSFNLSASTSLAVGFRSVLFVSWIGWVMLLCACGVVAKREKSAHVLSNWLLPSGNTNQSAYGN